MKVKMCTIYDNKVCDGCGECDVCDLDPNKICDNCGKCIEGYDYTGIQIDDLLMDDKDDSFDYDDWRFKSESNDDSDADEDTVFIDDVEGLREEIEEHERMHEKEHEHSHHNHDCDCDDHNH